MKNTIISTIVLLSSVSLLSAMDQNTYTATLSQISQLKSRAQAAESRPDLRDLERDIERLDDKIDDAEDAIERLAHGRKFTAAELAQLKLIDELEDKLDDVDDLVEDKLDRLR